MKKRGVMKVAQKEYEDSIRTLAQQKALICHDCVHPQQPHWCEERCKLSKAFDLAIDSMKKQLPVKPVKSETPRYGMGYEYHDWECPTCGNFLALEFTNKGNHHCKCGQAIDWEG